MNNHMDMELLAPAGSPEILKAVINAGADAIYVGGDRFGARAYAANFGTKDLIWAINYAHLFGRKLYLTVNTLLKNKEIEDELYDYILPLYEAGLDAVLVQDYGVLKYLHDNFPDLPIHISTQMTVSSKEGVMLLKSLGAERVVLSRELSLKEMKEIHEETGVELEAFVHGALCYSFSGMCLFSSILGGRSGNRGRCAQPCRLSYDCLENNKVIAKDQYILSLKDFCAYEKIKELKDAGIYSLKIEGRMKQAEYAYNVVKAYSEALEDNGLGNGKKSLMGFGNRGGFTDGYLNNHNDSNMITYNDPSLHKGDNLPVANIEEKKLPVQGFFVLQKGENAKLTLIHADYCVEIIGNTVEAAKNKPLYKSDVYDRLNKTGGTNFFFDNLEIVMDEDVFVPNGALNAIRRDGLEKLKNEILSQYRRTKSTLPNRTFIAKTINKANNQPYTAVQITTRGQLRFAASTENTVKRIYLPLAMYMKEELLVGLKQDIESCRKNEKEVYIVLPVILRNADVNFIESIKDHLLALDISGIMVSNSDSLSFAKRIFDHLPIIGDHSLYSYNNYSVEQLFEMGCNQLTAPLELNKAELYHRNNMDSEIVIYGRYPLMQTANCVCKNTKGCTTEPMFLELRDRYQAIFPVRNNCSFCYNTIYNSLPTNLISNIMDLQEMGFAGFRYVFTNETDEIIWDILNNKRYPKESTNGHYRRGVE